MDPQILNIINLFSLVSFVLLLFLAIARISYRYVSYKREGEHVPALLKRDLFFLAGLSTPFLGVLIFRAFSIVASEQWWYPVWLIGSALFALTGTAYWVYYEYFKIEQ
jgi:hypothetical protein